MILALMFGDLNSTLIIMAWILLMLSLSHLVGHGFTLLVTHCLFKNLIYIFVMIYKITVNP